MSVKLLTSGEVARQLNMPRWRLQYMVERETVPGPSIQVAGRRLFTDADVQAIEEAIRRRDDESKME